VFNFFIFFAIFAIVSLLLPWVCLFQINSLRNRVDELTKKLASKTKHVRELIEEESRPVNPITNDFNFSEFGVEIEKARVVKEPKHSTKESDSPSFEFNFSTNWFVWLGGIAIAFAAVYFVKYSIENNLVSPFARLIMGLFFGGALIIAGKLVHNRKETIANGEKISQALMGAALIDFYACFYTGSNLFDLLPSSIGFLGMAATTLLAIVYSVRFGAPIAILGLLGGFITPGLFHSDAPQASLLFVYLFFLVCGFMALVTILSWWFLGVFIILFSYIWVGLWLFDNFIPSDTIWLFLFIIGVCFVTAFANKAEKIKNGAHSTLSAMTLLFAILGGIIMLGFVTKYGGMRIEDWIYFGFIVLFAYGFSYFEQGKYVLIPSIAMLVNILMILTWWSEPQEMFFVILAFNILFSLPAFIGAFSRNDAHLWAMQGMAANIVYYLLSYWKTYSHFLYIKMFWGIYALVLALISMLLLNTFVKRKDLYAREVYKKILSVFAVGIVTFVTTAIFVEIDRKFFHLVLATEILTIAWINSRLIHIEISRYIIAIMLVLIFVSQIDHLYKIAGNFVTFQLMGDGVMSYKLNFLDRPILHYGFQGLLLSIATYFLLLEKDSRTVLFTEGFAVLSIMLAGTLAISNFYSVADSSTNILERGLINGFCMVLVLGLLIINKLTDRKSLIYWGIFMTCYLVFRVVMLEYIHFNPYTYAQFIGGLPLLNKLFLNYAIPVIFISGLIYKSDLASNETFKKYMSYFVFVGSMVYISLCVRHYFHPEYLNTGEIGNAEMYSYSAAWLLFGIGLAFTSVYLGLSQLRIASLVVIVITVGKVFLVDAKELEGLLRVLSFLGLGVSLLGLSYFYTRFLSIKK